MHEDFPLCSALDCERRAIIKVYGVPFCKDHAELLNARRMPSPQPATTITPDDVVALEADRQAWASVFQAKVSPEMEAACRAEIEAGIKSGWKEPKDIKPS